jgi:hypothetical protein
VKLYLIADDEVRSLQRHQAGERGELGITAE